MSSFTSLVPLTKNQCLFCLWNRIYTFAIPSEEMPLSLSTSATILRKVDGKNHFH